MKRRNESGFHIIEVSLIVVVLAVIGFTVVKVMNHDRTKDDGPGAQSQTQTGNKVSNQPSFAQQYAQGCEKKDVKFTSAPMRMSDLGVIRPLGAMLDGHVTPTDHVYVGPVNTKVADNTYPVLMPADGKVVEAGPMPAQYIGDRAGTQLAPEDHRLVIQFSCRYYAIYIHVHKLVPALADAIKGVPAGQGKAVSVALKAGDTVGYIGGDTFDWTPIDTEHKLSGFIHPDLYVGEPWKIHTVSPFDWYTGDLKKQLEAKSLRTAAPIGGKIDHDAPGKLVGTWFRTGTGGYSGNNGEAGGGGARYWDGHLSVVPDYINPDYSIVSIGNWQDKSSQFLVVNGVDPAKISAKDGLVKVQLSGFSYTSGKPMRPVATGAPVGTIALQVQAGEKLKVEKFIGKTPEQVTGFTSAAQSYER